MLISVFRSSFSSKILIFSVLGILLWMDALIVPPEMPASPALSPLYQLAYNWMASINWMPTIIAFLLLFAEAVLFNYAITERGLLSKTTLMVALLYLVLMSHAPALLTLNPVIMANIFLIIALNKVLQIYGKKESLVHILDAGLLVGVASLFYFPAVIFLAFLLISLLNYSFLSWREWVVSVWGLCVPYIFLFGFYFWTDQLTEQFNAYGNYFTEISHLKFFHYPGIYHIFWTIIVIMLFLTFGKFLNRLNERTISLRKKYTVIIAMFLAGLLSFFYVHGNFEYHIMLLFIPVSIFVGFYFIEVKKTFWSEVMFGLLLLVIILAKFL